MNKLFGVLLGASLTLGILATIGYAIYPTTFGVIILSILWFLNGFNVFGMVMAE